MLLFYVLKVYKWMIDSYESTVTQLEKTYKAVQQSFEDEQILFLDSSHNLATRSSALSNPKAITLHTTWTYENDVFTKVNSTQGLQSFPWLSASLSKDSGEEWDLTEWLERKRFRGDACPTADIVVQTWAIERGVHLYELRQYTLKVINEFAEEEILSVVMS